MKIFVVIISVRSGQKYYINENSSDTNWNRTQYRNLINVPVCGIYIYHTNLDGNFSSNFKLEARGEAVDWSTALQSRSLRVRLHKVSLKFFIVIIFPEALWPWGWLSLQQKPIPGIYILGKGGRCVGLTTLPHSCSDCLEIWDPQAPGTTTTIPVLQWVFITFAWFIGLWFLSKGFVINIYT